MKPLCTVYRLGVMPYAQAWDLQNALAERIRHGQHPPALLLLEHPHTYTFGRRGQREHLLWGEEELTRRGIALYWVDRGGDVTYHGPGQLVGYPLLLLPSGGASTTMQVTLPEGSSAAPAVPKAQAGLAVAPPAPDVVGYVRRLETVLILALARLGVPAQRLAGLSGAWVARPAGPAKIAAIGVKVDAHGITRHGFALNVNPEMGYFEGIVPCGLKGYAVTSLAQLLPKVPPMEEVAHQVSAAFGEVFGYTLMEGRL